MKASGVFFESISIDLDSMRRRELSGSRFSPPSADEERISALEHALEHGGDLWEFGTQTLKGFTDKNAESNVDEFAGMFDPDDPLLQDPNETRMATEIRMALVDAALSNGNDLTDFGTRTLKAALKERTEPDPAVDQLSTTAVFELFDRNIAQASEGHAPSMESKALDTGAVERQGTPSPRQTRPAAAAPAQSFGNNTLRGFAAGAPPAGFPTRNDDGGRATRCTTAAGAPAPPPGPPPQSPRTSQQAPRFSARAASYKEPLKSPRAPLHGSVTSYNQQTGQLSPRSAVAHAVVGMSPRAQLPPPPPSQPPVWKISGDMMHQKWGSVLRTLQPSTINEREGTAGSMSPRHGQVKDGTSVGTPRYGHLDKHSNVTLRPQLRQQRPLSGQYSPRHGISPRG